MVEGNNANFKEIGRRIYGLREACGYSAEEMAEKLGLEVSEYIGYEQDGYNVPISVVFSIANICGVDFTEIMTGAAARLDTYHVVKAGQGKPIDRYPGYRFADLAFKYGKKIMQPLLVTLDPSDRPAALVSHPGQEFNFVVSGSIVLTFDGRDILLGEGDSIYFNPIHPHGQRCSGAEKAVFLTVIAE